MAARAAAVIALALCCACAPLDSMAAAPSQRVHACLDSAAAKYSINPILLHSIAEQESSFNPQAVGAPNSNGSRDHGLMQINSAWLPTLRQHGIDLNLLYDPCVNAEVGAWILASNIQRLGLTWDAVGAYNASSPDKRLAYASRIWKRVKRRLEGGSTVASAPQARRQGGIATVSASSSYGQGMGAWEAQR